MEVHLDSIHNPNGEWWHELGSSIGNEALGGNYPYLPSSVIGI